MSNKQFSSALYWEQRYLDGNNSGAGSYEEKAIYKASIVNDVIQSYMIGDVIEYGCGDGNNLSLFNIKSYIGIDVSKKAIELCNNRFKLDTTKSFILYDPMFFRLLDMKADLTLSLEVLFHLVEESIYKKYIADLFNSSRKFVLIFSSNIIKKPDAQHMVYREFLLDIPDNYLLVSTIYTPKELKMLSDFYLFQKKEEI